MRTKRVEQPRIPTGWEIVNARVAEELKGFSDAYKVRDRMLAEERARKKKGKRK